MILVIDNYDSFTYNLVDVIKTLGKTVRIFLNDQITLSDIQQLHPEAIIISPGPGTPQTAGISLAVIQQFYTHVPILGVCLGHQAIAEAFGGKIIPARKPMHGKTSPIIHDGKTIFQAIPNPFLVTRYHSLIVDRPALPSQLTISAWTTSREIMGVRLEHNPVPVEGVQFHPEAILTTAGKQLLQNFLHLC